MVLLQISFNFGDTIKVLQEVGVFDYLLPFLLIFSILFAILEKTKILGSEKTNINIVVSTVVSLLVLVQPGIIQTINLFLPRVSLIIVVILMGLLVISMVSGEHYQGLKGSVFALAVILIIISIIIALVLPETGGSFSLAPQDREVLLKIGIPLGVLLIAIVLVTRKPPVKGENSIAKVFEGITKGFGGRS